jgi:hypothetical protein
MNSFTPTTAKEWIGIFLAFGIVFFLIFKKSEVEVTRNSSIAKYTKAIAIEKCVINSSWGLKFEYSIRGNKYNFCHLNDINTKYKIGDEILVKVYLDDLSVHDIIKTEELKFPKPPHDGWDTPPK